MKATRIGAFARARRPSRARLQEERAKSASVAIASSLFLALIAAALLVGGHAAIGPLLRSAIAARDAKETGDVVYTMPDGIFCRHMSFDNVTARSPGSPSNGVRTILPAGAHLPLRNLHGARIERIGPVRPIDARFLAPWNFARVGGSGPRLIQSALLSP